MYDALGRCIDYMRISLNDNCNLKCFYCVSRENRPNYKIPSFLSEDSVIKIVQAGESLGIRKVRLTGGEPLLREDIGKIIKGIAHLNGDIRIAMTTNGILLENKAKELISSGLNSINISIDSLNEDKYFAITGGRLNKVLEGIKRCKELGLSDIKINSVLLKNYNLDEVEAFLAFGEENNVLVRFIELMPVGEGINHLDNYISSEEIINIMKLKPIDIRPGEGPATYYKDSRGRLIGFIKPISHNFCGSCSRIRITSDGKLKLCLYSDEEIDLKPYLSSHEKLLEMLYESILRKPTSHQMNKAKERTLRDMVRIGG